MGKQAGIRAKKLVDAETFIREMDIAQCVLLMRLQHDLDARKQAGESSTAPAGVAGAWCRQSGSASTETPEPTRERLLGRLSALLHAAGWPAAGEAQFPQLRATVQTLSAPQVVGVWLELCECIAQQGGRLLDAPTAWERFRFASAIITGVAGHGHVLCWTKAPGAEASDAVPLAPSAAPQQPAAAPPVMRPGERRGRPEPEHIYAEWKRLKAERRPATDLLAKTYGVSRDTIERDIKPLRKADEDPATLDRAWHPAALRKRRP